MVRKSYSVALLVQQPDYKPKGPDSNPGSSYLLVSDMMCAKK